MFVVVFSNDITLDFCIAVCLYCLVLINYYISGKCHLVTLSPGQIYDIVLDVIGGL